MSPADGTLRASAILARAHRRDVRPNIWASLRSDSGLPAWALSRYAATAVSSTAPPSGTAWSCCPLAGMAGGPATGAARCRAWVWRAALAPAEEPGASGCGRGRTRRSTAGHGTAEVPARRPVFRRPGLADEPDQELIRAHETDRRPGRDHCPDQAVGPALGHVRREGRRDPRSEQPAARDGTRNRCRAADRTSIELAYTRPSIVAGSSRAVIPLSPCARTTA